MFHTVAVVSVRYVEIIKQYERRDALILSGPLVPPVSDGEDCKHLIQRLFRDHARLNIIISNISISNRLWKITRGTPEVYDGSS